MHSRLDILREIAAIIWSKLKHVQQSYLVSQTLGVKWSVEANLSLDIVGNLWMVGCIVCTYWRPVKSCYLVPVFYRLISAREILKVS